MLKLNCFNPKFGAFTLKGDLYDGGEQHINLMHNNEVVASWPIEYFFDFLSDIYLEAGPEVNYLDKGRRYRQLIHSYSLPELNQAE